jgi:predicted transcriptional regulator
MEVDNLPRREREVLEVLSALTKATVSDVQTALASAPTYSTVRTILGRLERKGLVERQSHTHAHLYRVAQKPARIRESALRGLTTRLFGGSAVRAATALLSMADHAKPEELDELQRAIDRARAQS